MASFLLLLHLLPPQPAGRKRTRKISVAQAIDHLVVFHKSCTSLDAHLEREENRQPYLLTSGTSKEAISSFFIVFDKKLIPCLLREDDAIYEEAYFKQVTALQDWCRASKLEMNVSKTK
ncbi:hypothetical protein AAFF_G00212090 [Aldrovandia affinis]|uniref:Uncharacterized protein n=1 Tax=Aldrovandia affinis TaxID=143900 RepID=A0AAD7QZZ8_9TELE|nr:hypothetical protein AAFF_G00212090 [Aldrovandia affinis]